MPKVKRLAPVPTTRQCERCGIAVNPYDLTAGYCDDCDYQYGCSCCGGDIERCGCAFKQTGHMHYDCQKHGRVVRVVPNRAQVSQGDPAHFDDQEPYRFC